MITPPARTVAVIDDDRRVLASLANLLASGGYGTRAYESPLDFFADGYAGLVCVITDLGMRPIDEDALLRAVDAALARAHVLRKEAEDTAALQALFQSLTPREQELLPLLAGGLLNKQVAGILGITEYTVQVHRGHIMRKMRADSFATLVRQASRLRLEASPTTAFDA